MPGFFQMSSTNSPAARTEPDVMGRTGRVPGRTEQGRHASILSGAECLALVDQAVVSGASFLTTILIGRFANPSELGAFAIATSVLTTALAVQESVIAMPYTMQRHRPYGTPAEHAGAALVETGLLSAVVITALAGVGFVLYETGVRPVLTATVGVLAGITPFVLLREFARRFAFAHLHMAESLALDSGVAAMQTAGLGLLVWSGWLSAITAYSAIGIACAAAATFWLYHVRDRFAIRMDRLRTTMNLGWDLGKWLFASQIALSAQGYAAYWLLAWMVGTATTGVYAACMSIALFSNPIILGFSNFLAPKAALSWKEGDSKRLRQGRLREALLVGSVMALFCIAIIIAGDTLMRVLYPASEYAGQGHTVAVLAAAMLAIAVGMPATNALTSMGRPSVILWISVWSAGLTAVLCWWFVLDCGVVGAAYGYLTGNAVRSVTCWGAFLALVPSTSPRLRLRSVNKDSASGAVLSVLQKFVQGSQATDWTIERLDEGDQAHIYVAGCLNTRYMTAEAHRRLVVKLYKPPASADVEGARSEFELLSRLHAVLNGKMIDGWKYFIPAPLYLCDSPPALVMTLAPGRRLRLWLESGRGPVTRLLAPLPQAIVAALQRFWSLGQVHGDLNFDNVLCDITARCLSFIDPERPRNSHFCDSVATHRHPATRDLGYLLYETAVTVRYDIAHPRARRRRQMFTIDVLRAFIERVGPLEEALSLLDEIGNCARQYLATLSFSLTLRGLWHLLVRRIAVTRMNTILAEVRADAMRRVTNVSDLRRMERR